MRTVLFVFALLALIVSGFIFSSTSQASPSPWHPAATASANFLQQAGSSTFNAGFGGPQRTHLGTSVMPHTDNMCSADSTDTPASCSVDPGPDRQCSAHCDSAQSCSAFNGTPPGPVTCSVNGRNGGRCSVLQPVATTVISPSNCSAFFGTTADLIQCSIMAPGRRQACSAQNPATINIQNQCSAHSFGSDDVCSVLNGGTVFRNYCSTGFAAIPATKTCSSLATATICSINSGQRGVCTNLTGAPAGTCSAQAPGSFCSVIGGAAGTLCVQP